MRQHRRVMVYAQRGDRPSYSYVAHDHVRQSKSGRVAHDVAEQVFAHETRSGLTGWVQHFPTGSVVEVNGDNRFVVRAG